MLLPTSLMLVFHITVGFSILQLNLNPVILFSFQLSNNCWLAALYLYHTLKLGKFNCSFVYAMFIVLFPIDSFFL